VAVFALGGLRGVGDPLEQFDAFQRGVRARGAAAHGQNVFGVQIHPLTGVASVSLRFGGLRQPGHNADGHLRAGAVYDRLIQRDTDRLADAVEQFRHQVKVAVFDDAQRQLYETGHLVPVDRYLAEGEGKLVDFTDHFRPDRFGNSAGDGLPGGAANGFEVDAGNQLGIVLHVLPDQRQHVVGNRQARAGDGAFFTARVTETLQKILYFRPCEKRVALLIGHTEKPGAIYHGLFILSLVNMGFRFRGRGCGAGVQFVQLRLQRADLVFDPGLLFVVFRLLGLQRRLIGLQLIRVAFNRLAILLRRIRRNFFHGFRQLGFALLQRGLAGHKVGIQLAHRVQLGAQRFDLLTDDQLP